MKKNRLIAVIIMAMLLAPAVSFAAPNTSPLPNSCPAEVKKDPVQTLERMREKVLQKYKDKEISEEKKNTIITKIDGKIKELKEFNKLTPQQKKDKLKKDFNTRISDKVKSGKMTQQEADKVLERFKAKLDKWDGTGYGFFFHKGMDGLKNKEGKLLKHKGMEGF